MHFNIFLGKKTTFWTNCIRNPIDQFSYVSFTAVCKKMLFFLPLKIREVSPPFKGVSSDEALWKVSTGRRHHLLYYSFYLQHNMSMIVKWQHDEIAFLSK